MTTRSTSSRWRSQGRAALLAVAVGAPLACGADVPTPRAQREAPAALDDAVVEEESEHYNFTLESPKVAEVGRESVARLGLTTLDPWHMNLEFPAVLIVDELDGVDLHSARQSKEEALHFAEDGAAFEIRFTPDATGRHEVVGTLRFAVCQTDACLPQAERFAFVVDVEERSRSRS